MQRPVFFAIGIIITAYLPIFTLQAVEGRLFKPMAWTVAFALAGALTFSMIIAPVLASILFRRGAKEWQNPVMRWLIRALSHRRAHGPLCIAISPLALPRCFSSSRCILPLAVLLVRSFCLTSTKARSGFAERLPPSEGPTRKHRFHQQSSHCDGLIS